MSTKTKKRRMRLPNGFGSIHQIGDGKLRRRPWRARILENTTHDPETGETGYKYLTIGYYATEQEAIASLYEYHRDPYTTEAATVTFATVFEMWQVRKYPELSPSAQRGYNAAFKNCSSLHALRMRDIRTWHMEKAMDSPRLQYGSQSLMKCLWNQLFTYALERDIVRKNYADYVKLRDTAPSTTRTSIPPEDRIRLWHAADSGDWTAKLVMVYCYTGMRATELLEVNKADVDLNTRILLGGLKTAAGKNRRIPIHRDILPIMDQLMSTPGVKLVMNPTDDGWEPLTYHRWNDILLKRLMRELKMPYTGHFAHHTCATMLREANVADDLRKLILGHANGDITDRYTHHPDYMLVAAIDQIPGRAMP